MFSILAIVDKDEVATAAQEVAKSIRRVGMALGLGDAYEVADAGTVEYAGGYMLLDGYSVRRMVAQNQLEVTACAFRKGLRMPTSTLYLFYGDEFLDFSIERIEKYLRPDHKPFLRMPLSKLTGDPHDLVFDHMLSVSGATKDVVERVVIKPCPEYNCLAMRLDVNSLNVK